MGGAGEHDGKRVLSLSEVGVASAWLPPSQVTEIFAPGNMHDAKCALTMLGPGEIRDFRQTAFEGPHFLSYALIT